MDRLVGVRTWVGTQTTWTHHLHQTRLPIPDVKIGRQRMFSYTAFVANQIIQYLYPLVHFLSVKWGEFLCKSAFRRERVAFPSSQAQQVQAITFPARGLMHPPKSFKVTLGLTVLQEFQRKVLVSNPSACLYMVAIGASKTRFRPQMHRHPLRHSVNQQETS